MHEAFKECMPAVWDRLTDWCGEEFAARMKTVEYVSDEAVIATEYINAMNHRDRNWRYVRDGVYTAMSQSLKETERRVRQKAAARPKSQVKAAPKAPEQIALEKEAKLARTARLGAFGTLGIRGDKRSKPCVDHLGNKYPSIKAMCDAYGICSKLFYVKRKEGHSVEAILTRNTPKINVWKCKDHLGQEFESKAAMCQHWGVSPKGLALALKGGRTLEEFLTGNYIHAGKSCKDHLGREYKSVTEMCRAYGINRLTFQSRTSYGWSVEEALTGKSPYTGKSGAPMPCTDHRGKEFPSISAMCQHWGVAVATFHSRRARGWSLEDALEGNGGKVNPAAKPRVDHLGNEFTSFNAMALAYGVSAETVERRMRGGMTLQEALTVNRPQWAVGSNKRTAKAATA